ncbi:UNVERIFIED_CONTAM: hypothetical protein GTU68_007542, partial [Idotea baltica]|nr:hypothetical protein [Idotea baltica]
MPSTILNSTKFILMKNNRSTFNFIFQKYKLFLDRSYITVQKETFNSNLGTGIEDKCLLSINSLSLFNLTYPSHINFSSCKKLCWNCNSTEIQEYFCNQCKLIQPIDKNLNYFALLGIETSFKVCKSSLTLKFRKLQNVFHPDKYSMKSTNEMDIAAEHSSLLNKAYNVILHPVSRGEYMLLLERKPIHEA